MIAALRLLVVAALASGCGADSTLQPAGPQPPGNPPPAPQVRLHAIAVEPSEAVLSVNVSEAAVLLRITAFDPSGRAIVLRETPSYTIDDPAVATVSETGIVTPRAVGTARVTVALTSAGVAKTASMVVTVTRPPFERIFLWPTRVDLVTAPVQTAELVVAAYDAAGSVLRSTPSFTTDAPAVATVSSTGLITAVGPGSATITTSFTVAGVTRLGTTLVSVVGPTIVNGVYDLVAPITSWDPVWGDLTGSEYTATLRFQQDPNGVPGIAGTFSDLVLTGPYADSTPQSGVIVSRLYGNNGLRIVIELVSTTRFTIALIPQGALASAPVIQGGMGLGGHIGGTFTATRRGGP